MAEERVRKRGSTLSFVERYNLLKLHQQHLDWTHQELSEHTGIPYSLVKQVIESASRQAADLMAVYAEPMMRLWIQAAQRAASRGDHRPARDWLLHAGSIEQLESAKAGGTSVVVINAPLPGMPHAVDTIVIPTTAKSSDE